MNEDILSKKNSFSSDQEESKSTLVSIITVVYNGEKFLRNTIDSVIKQTYSNIEYIVIDGGSKDRTLDIVHSYGTNISKLISEPDKGIYDAMNKGIKLSKGELVCILNSDDWLEDTAIEEFVTEYNKSKSNYTILVGNTNRIGQNDEKLFVMRNSKNQLDKKISYTMAVTHPSVCVSRSIYLDKFHGFNLKYDILADYDLIYKASKDSEIEFIFINKELVNMREGGVSDSFKLKVIYKRSYERFLIRLGSQNFIKNFIYCTKFFCEETVRQFLKKYFPKSVLLKNKR